MKARNLVFRIVGLCFSLAASALGQTIYDASTNATTTWADMDRGSGFAPGVVAVDFGTRGMGTVTLGGFNGIGAAFINAGSGVVSGNYALAGGDSVNIGSYLYPGSSTSVSAGLTLALNGPLVVPHPGPYFATATFKLDSGVFEAGDLLIVANLARQNDFAGALVLGPLFDPKLSGDSVIPNTSYNSAFGVWGYDDDGNAIYAVNDNPAVPAGSMNKSQGEVFRFNESTNEFTVKLLLGDYGATGEDGDGITPLGLPATPFSFIVAAPVPEPSGAVLAGLAAGVVALRRRRR